ncbi:MAG: shikimate kinase [Candidatus Cryptobacteroides sp.]
MVLALTGFMGCGKSSVGRRLRTLLSCDYVDLDSYIEDAQGRSIPEIFASEGEVAFRSLELSSLRSLLSFRPSSGQFSSARPDAPHFSCSPDGPLPSRTLNDKPLIISLGGGTLTTPSCASLVKENTFCIYLRASIDTLLSNLKEDYASRPMLDGATDEAALRRRIASLMDARAAIYESTAALIVDIDPFLASAATLDSAYDSIARSISATL